MRSLAEDHDEPVHVVSDSYHEEIDLSGVPPSLHAVRLLEAFCDSVRLEFSKTSAPTSTIQASRCHRSCLDEGVRRAPIIVAPPRVLPGTARLLHVIQR
jgi:hypothetical protein